MKSSLIVALSTASFLAACSGNDSGLDPQTTCHIGTYRTDSGEFVDISPLSSGALRWRTADGQTGNLQQGPGGLWSGNTGWTSEAHPAHFDLGACGTNAIEIEGLAGLNGGAVRLDFPAMETEFEAEGETLAGRLVLPLGDDPVPLVVLVHGSEDYSARDFYSMQRILPALGVAAFVYDKRGTGSSSGNYTQDFDLLAGDAAAALAEARRLGGNRIASAGYLGTSQGGWVAPYAASMSDPDFVIVAYGMAEGPLSEDREEVIFSLEQAGYGNDEEAMAGARALAEAAGRMLASDFAEGQSELADLKDRYRDRPWYDVIQGEFTHEFLARPIWQVRAAWPFFDQGTSWDYAPAPILEALDMPVLWVLAGNDAEAPSHTTRQILADLQAEGLPVDVAVFPSADHGIIEFETGPDGERISTRYSEGYFHLLAEWATDRQLDDDYGTAQLMPRNTPDEAAE